jgi:glucokinase
MSHILGLDFGGTKLAAGLFDQAGAALIDRAECPTPVLAGAPASLAAMVDLARALLKAHPATLTGVGVSFGGPVEQDGRTVRLSMHVPGWENTPLAERLEAIFSVEARVANDGDAAALAEHRLGAGRGARHLLYVTASTGVGGGVIIDGRLHRGERGWAGEIGHMLLDPHGPPCPCGRNGCLESLASGLSIARDARALLADAAGASMLRSLPPDQLTAQHVAEAAAGGDPLAQRVWGQAAEWLGYGLASAANLLNPGRIVVGGGLTRAGELLFEPLRRVAAQRAMDPALQIVPAQLGGDVGILGGVSLWL